MSGEHTGATAALAARVRRLERLLEQRGLVDPQELDRGLETQPVAQRPHRASVGLKAANVGFSAAGWGDRASREARWACVEIVFVGVR